MYYRLVFNEKTARWNLELSKRHVLGVLIQWVAVQEQAEEPIKRDDDSVVTTIIKTRTLEFDTLAHAEDFVEEKGIHLMYHQYRSESDPVNGNRTPDAEGARKFRKTCRNLHTLPPLSGSLTANASS